MDSSEAERRSQMRIRSRRRFKHQLIEEVFKRIVEKRHEALETVFRALPSHISTRLTWRWEATVVSNTEHRHFLLAWGGCKSGGATLQQQNALVHFLVLSAIVRFLFAGYVGRGNQVHAGGHTEMKCLSTTC